ncbi:hypothetical protein [Dictyobacter formicarum]|uniref:GH26 domain-containing protein n=1 Tax=Dictyobacter formicarum TaxID=2778368 RepID=A0ABQ3VT56_9CHLR|nr:hypothetical protein [Dictyobacter formicarum]GHO89395.1 hypothetical protein KSZ_74010 [Dictyobacter formicarum]
MLETFPSPIPHTSRRRRLEPHGERVIHGAGQDPEAFKQYFECIGEHKPELFMTYTTLKADMPTYFQRLKQELDAYLPFALVPQIGLHFAGDALDPDPEPHYEQQVADGQLDAQIRGFCEGLRLLERPAYVRIGFEFNGPWNGYEPKAYKAAWIRVVNAFREHHLDNVAAVWCYFPLPGSREHEQGIDRDYLAYYPGDDYVDWWSIDLFSTEEFSRDNTLAFMKDAEERGFPVMIGESTPRWVGGVEGGEETWKKWFVPYFSFIRTQPSVKAFCYISWNWAKYPVWSDWGDARIWVNSVILDHYRQELAHPLYHHTTR